MRTIGVNEIKIVFSTIASSPSFSPIVKCSRWKVEGRDAAVERHIQSSFNVS